MTGELTRRRLAAGAILLGAVPAAVASAADVGRWKRAESRRFIVYSDGSDWELRATVEKLEQFDWTLRQVHGLDPKAAPSRKLDIYLVQSETDLRRSDPSISDNTGGFYSAGTGNIFAIMIRQNISSSSRHGTADSWSETIIFHEYTHHFMFQYFPFPYPTWLVEGWAEYFGVTTIDGPNIEVGGFDAGIVRSLQFDAWLPLETLLGKSLAQISADDWLMFYAQAWLLTHYMQGNATRRRQLVAYTDDVARGSDPVSAMTRASGMSLAELTKALRAYVHGAIPYIKLVQPPESIAPNSLQVTPLPKSADALLLDSVRVCHGRVDAKAAPALLASLRKSADRFPGDRLAQLTLARAEVDFGDRAQGQAMLARWLAANPDDVEALELAAKSRLDAAAKDPDHAHALALEAQPLLGRAYKLDTERYQTLWSYVRSRRYLDATYPSNNTLEALLKALELAPQVGQLRYEAARALLLRGRYADATGILAPMLNDPHGQDTAEVRKLQAQIDEAAKAAAAGKP